MKICNTCKYSNKETHQSIWNSNCPWTRNSHIQCSNYEHGIHNVKESSPCLANKETYFFKPYSIESSPWSIYHLKNSSNPSILLFLLCKISSIKMIQFHHIMVQYLQSCTIIYSLSCSQILSKIVGDITQSNNGRTILKLEVLVKTINAWMWIRV